MNPMVETKTANRSINQSPDVDTVLRPIEKPAGLMMKLVYAMLCNSAKSSLP